VEDSSKSYTDESKGGSLAAVTNAEDKELIRSLLEKFPSTATDARGIREVEWRDKLFTPHFDGSETYFPIPNNVVDFKDNLLFISLLKIAQIRDWRIVISTVKLPVTTLKTDKGMYFAGYVAMSQQEFAGQRIKPSNLFEKGQLARQTEAVIAHVGKRNAHIRRTPHSIGKILADMGGFTRTFWGARSAISAIFANLPIPKVDDIVSYMLSGGELIGKIVRKSLPYQNGGVFRKEELQYLDGYYRTELTTMEEVHRMCNNPKKGFAETFYERVDELAQICKNIDKSLGALFAQRAQYLFRSSSKRKSDIKWAQKSLNDKIAAMSLEDLERFFVPTNLPGFIKAKRTSTEDNVEDYCMVAYHLDDGKPLFETQLAVCVSYEIIRADKALDN
jgi:hypothetical protein